MGDHQHGAAGQHGEQIVHQCECDVVVEVFGGFVDHHHLCAGQHDPRQCESLAFATRQRLTVLADHRVESVREARQPLVELHC